MTHGAPDYSNVRKTEFSYRLDDLAEVAARLGSPMVFDRRGEVFFIDKFDKGLVQWLTNWTGTGGDVNLDYAHANYGGFSVQLIGGSDGGKSAYITKYLGMINLSTFGIEQSILIGSNIYRIGLLAKFFTGTTMYEGILFYYPQTNEIKIVNVNGSEVTIDTNTNLDVSGLANSYMKLVIDWVNKKYIRALFNGEEVDLSDYDLYTVSDATSVSIFIETIVSSITGYNGEAFVDYIIVTRNE